jgi:primary-amine oxidase
MGTQANDLTLGCDCLGSIHYMVRPLVGHQGPSLIKDSLALT